MVKIYINRKHTIINPNAKNSMEIYKFLMQAMHLTHRDFYLEQNGKRLKDVFDEHSPIYVRMSVLGGKGGFGSMLRAIGAQIEKTTNREACRDLSGRRLRDINEEKRLKAWLEKQGEREREAEERKRRKIEKLLAVPKHEFKDDEYEETRSKLTEKVCTSFEEGFKKADKSEIKLKRKNESHNSRSISLAKKKKRALWLDDEITTSDEESDKYENIANDTNNLEKYSENTN